jgi:hypothetical protein
VDMTSLYDGIRLRFSNPITVTLTRPGSYGGGAEASVTVRYVQEQPIDESAVESPLGGSLGGEKTAFRMWLVELGGLEPHRGCLVTKADGTVWHVDRVEVLCRGRAFRLHVTRRPA